MKLAEWIAQQGMKRKDFAKKARLSAPYVTELCQGTVWPSRPVAKRIARVTGKDVMPNDFMI